MTPPSLPFTPDVHRDLWLFFGESEEDAELLIHARPILPPYALVHTGRAHLRLDTPFGRAFAEWRKEKAQAEMREGMRTLVLNGGVEGTIFGVSLGTSEKP